jgi:cytochrome c-type biogenesis protein CcmH/NrfF
MAPENADRAGSDQEPEQILQDLSNDLMSPYCPGRTISSCPSEAARKLEDHILEQAQSGKSREQIETELVERFGSDIVGYAPQPIVLWGTAVVAMVALVLVAMLGKRWVRKSRVVGPGAGRGAAAPDGKPTRHELDALDDALDEEEGF